MSKPKFGVYFNKFDTSGLGIGVYTNWIGERYFYISIFNYELSIGKRY